MSYITLHFSEQQSASLDAVEFLHSAAIEPRISFRGKGFTAGFTRHTFQWSPAVRAMSILLLWTKANYIIRSSLPAHPLASLSGAAGSSAASLDYALSKKPLWLLDMFGTTANGKSLAQSLFIRWNSERKRGGNVIVAVNPRQIASTAIHLKINGKHIDDPATAISLAATIEQTELRLIPQPDSAANGPADNHLQY